MLKPSLLSGVSGSGLPLVKCRSEPVRKEQSAVSVFCAFLTLDLCVNSTGPLGLFGFPLLLYDLESVLGSERGQSQGLLYLFSFFQDYHPVIPVGQYWNTVVLYILFSFLVIYAERRIPVVINPSWAEEDILVRISVVSVGRTV